MKKTVTTFLLSVVVIFVSIHYADLGQTIESNNDATHRDIGHQWTTVSESRKEEEKPFLIIPSSKTSSAQYASCNTCGPHSTGCSMGNGRVTCYCRAGYVQRNYVCEVGCGTLRNCENGGNCQNQVCSCIQGTSGHFCENIEDCTNTCPNVKLTYCGFDGKLKTPYCKCVDETLGYDPEKLVCRKSCSTCENGGLCQLSGFSLFCKCINGTSGDFCQEVPDCAQHKNLCKDESKCYFDVERKTAACECPDMTKAYDKRTGKCRSTCDNDACENGGMCDHDPLSDSRFCKCLQGTSGDHCEEVNDCESHRNFCKDESKCYFNVDRKKVDCECPDEKMIYDRQIEKCRIGCGGLHDCVNGGRCDRGLCVCYPGTSGIFCEIIEKCEDLCPNLRQTNCAFDVGRKKPYCECYSKELGYDSEKQICKKTCDNDECENGGECQISGYSMFCKCLAGTSGDLCQKVDDCAPGKKFCKGGAICYFDVDRKSVDCECPDDKMEYDIRSKTCRRTCDYDVCKNGGTCLALGTSKFCTCFYGTSGDYCEEIQGCLPHNNFCKDKSVCYFDVEKKEAACKCLDRNMAYDEDSEKCRGTCDNDVCKNGGTCLAHGTSKFCTCFYGTSGDYCEEIQGCLPQNNFCKDKSKCYFDVERKETACKCLDRNMAYDEDSEKCRVSCNNDIPCKNSGVCTGSDIKFCKCKPGTGGDLCERVDSCEIPDFCGKNPGVTCVFDNRELKGVCLCEDGSKKFHPITKECKRTCSSSDDCSNGGTCDERGGSKFCGCFRGTSGDLCEIVNDCESKIRCKGGSVCEFDVATREVVCRCKNAGKRYELRTESCKTTCEMLDGITSHSTCQNGGTCGGSADLLFCKCLPKTSGDLCETVDECETMMCKDDATCAFDIEKAKAVCSCKDEKVYDPYNERCRESCSKRSCSNGGNCGELNLCHCLQGTSGDFCESIDVCDVLRNKCKDNASCDYDVEKQEAVCKCPNNDEIYDTTNESCRRECDDDKRKCSHGGKCGDLNFCQCLPGTMGDFCDTIEGCAKEEDECNGDSYCDYDVTKQEAVCRCKYVGELYDKWSQKCKKTCDENNIECRNGGSCDGTGGLRFCKCLSGTKGDLCDIVDECEKNPNKCKDGAECVFDIETQEAECECEDDEEQYDPLNEICKKTVSDPCSSNLCQNGGKCKVEENNVATCDCSGTFIGTFCENDACNPNLCQNDGVCSVENSARKCKCKQPFSGELCEIVESDPCASNPCQNGGQCKVDKNNVVCICDRIFIGKFCETACDCGSYAVSCSITNGEKTCTCPEKFTERNGACEKTECTCSNGNCKIVNGQEVCSCFEGYALEGDNCKKLTCSKTACINGTCVVRRGNAEVCLCAAGFTLVEDTCKKGICRMGTCYGGKCEIVEGELVCVCEKGYHLDGVGCYATQCKEQTCFGGKCVVKDNKEICRCKEGYVLMNNVCKKILCEEKSCFGGQCHLVDGKEKCTCPVGFSVYEDVCREDLRHYRSQLRRILLSNSRA